MNTRIWLVFTHEFNQNVFKKSFIIVLLIIPMIITLLVGMAFLIQWTLENDSPVGYVDLSGIFSEQDNLPVNTTSSDSIPILAFDTEEQARLALDNGEIQAYYVLANDYFETGNVNLFFYKPPGENAARNFYDFLQARILSTQMQGNGLSTGITRRIVEGSSMTVQSFNNNRTFPGGAPSFGDLVPLLVSISFIGLIITGAGYIISSIFKERQNRTIEILSTSISPREIVWGKVLGSIGVNLMQLLFWVLVAIIAVYIAGYWLDYEWFRNVNLDWSDIGKFLLIALPTYIFIASLTFSLGVIVGTQQDSERIAPLMMMAFILPMYLFGIIGSEPKGTLSVLLTLLPFTSLFTYGIRSLVTEVPFWQAGISSLVQLSAAIVTISIAVYLYRNSWLHPNFRFSLKNLRGRANGSI